MADKDVTIKEMRDAMALFIREREWERYHAPKDLAMATAIEASELLENFLWRDLSADEIQADSDLMGQIKDEVADVFLYLCSMCNALDIDLSDAVVEKLEKNRRKYPRDVYKGRAYVD